jgi:hypothetical protein
MESVLRSLITSLKSTLDYLNGQKKPTLDEALHNSEKLPNSTYYKLALEALDLLSGVRLL